jgi:hypothetical protein
MGVVGEGLHDVGTGVLKIAVQGTQRLRIFQRHLGYEFSGRQIPPTFHFEQITFGADDAVGIQSFHQPPFHRQTLLS